MVDGVVVCSSADGFDQVRIMVGDPAVFHECSMSVRGPDDPGLGDCDVVDAEEIFDLVWRTGCWHLKAQPRDSLENGSPARN